MKYATQLSKEFVESHKHIVPPWGQLGYITYKRTYSRNGEEWWQTVARCCQGLLDIGGAFSHDEIEQLYEYVFNLKCCFSGRALWQLGTDTIHRVGADSLQNCWHVAVSEPYAFGFTFNQLMLGGGVGYNITPEKVYELPTVKYSVRIERRDEHDVDFIVPDNREGWVDLLKRVLDSFFVTGKNLIYSTVCIRQKGKPIKSFGGTASGSEILVEGIEKIVGILSSRVGYKLRPIDCLDIMNIIGTIVVAGNVRRSAELAAGSPEDMLFLTAKNWSRTTIPNWRNMSNNSVICNSVEELPDVFWEGYHGHGEPYGLINLELCRSFGRLADEINYRPDYEVTGTNPCGEIPLESYEACNLGEIFLPNIQSMDEFLTASALIYKACKTISTVPFSEPRVNEVVAKNRRLGISLCGLLQSNWIQTPDCFGTVYNSLEELDTDYSRQLGVKTSVKLTTIKPSGTLSLLAGVTPGIHPAYARQYIRRIRFSSTDPLVKVCRDAGYHVEPLLNLDGTRNLATMVVSFPTQVPKGTIVASDLSAIDQLNFQTMMQEYWSDNSISMTCYYRQEELPLIRDYLKQNFTDSIKTVSFLLHAEHGFQQAPYEEITEEKYKELSSGTGKIVNVNDVAGYEIEDNLECSSGACPVK